MKKITALLLALALCLLAGCQNPNAIQMDLSRGYGEQLKLLHLNASTGENLQLLALDEKVLVEIPDLQNIFTLCHSSPPQSLSTMPLVLAR